MFFKRACTVLALAAFAGLSLAVNPIKVSGSDFVDSSTNKRFGIIGVDYQPGGSSGFSPGSGVDPLTNSTICLRDAALIQKLGANTIRVYNLDGTLNHDECASIFNAAGIYMILDVNSPLAGGSLNRYEPWTTYTESYLQRIFEVVEGFKNYPNTLGFFAGNEIINDVTSASVTPPYIRAVIRDLKQYIAKHASRPIPVGYSAADVREMLADSWEYFQCALNGDGSDLSRADFFGLNSYSWCGEATFTTAGYDSLVNMFARTSIPVFFSEYGCNLVEPRVFNEVQALYGDEMLVVFDGGLVYEYSEGPSNYGLVNLNENDTVTIREDFENLYAQYSKLDQAVIEFVNAAAATVVPPICSASLITSVGFNTNFTIPDTAVGGGDLIKNGIKSSHKGKFVPVTKTACPFAVYYANGTEMAGLAVKKLGDGESNFAGENTSGSATSVSSSSSTSSTATPTPTKHVASPTATKTSAASLLNVKPLSALGTVAFAVFWGF